jgi:thiol-disulfide isomerase/thioredoxin
MALKTYIPSFKGASEWLNSEPLEPSDVRGRVVLVDFWTLTSINWLRTQPHVRAWSRTYREDGLVVIAVHTPEFSFEHDVDLVRKAGALRGIDYPIVVDNDYAVWSAFANHYWPALYFVDRDGVIRDEHFGEGRYAESERSIQDLLGVSRPPARIEAAGIEAEADWGSLETPETYLGYARGDRFASPDAGFDQPHGYRLPERQPSGSWALSGNWTITSECATVEQPGGSLACRFRARDVNLVMNQTMSESIAFQVRVDGDPPATSHGVDVDENGAGVLGDGRLYGLVRTDGTVRERTVEITFEERGAEAYAFTFG